MALEPTELYVQLVPWPWNLQSLLSNWHHVGEDYRALCPTGTMAMEPTESFVQFEPCIFPRSFMRPLTSAEIKKECYIIKDRENLIFFIFKTFIHWEYRAQQVVRVHAAWTARNL